MPVKSVVIIYIVNLQYVPIAKVVNINCGYCGCGVWNKGSSALFLLFFHLPLGTLFFLNLFLKLR